MLADAMDHKYYNFVKLDRNNVNVFHISASSLLMLSSEPFSHSYVQRNDVSLSFTR